MTMTTTIKGSGHEDKGDKDDVTSTQRLPSENLRTKNPECGPKFHRIAEIVIFGPKSVNNYLNNSQNLLENDLKYIQGGSKPVIYYLIHC